MLLLQDKEILKTHFEFEIDRIQFEASAVQATKVHEFALLNLLLSSR